MRPASPELSRIVRGSHRMCARARIVAPGQTGTNPDGDEIPILAGAVTLDASADTRGRLDLVTDGTGWSTRPDGPITPYGTEVFVERGIVHGNGDREWISQGYFRLYDVGQAAAPNGQLRIDARDRMSGLIDARLLAPVQLHKGQSLQSVFEVLVHEVYPGAVIEFDFDAVNTTLAAQYVGEQDRYGLLLDVARAHGKIMYWDYAGTLQVRDAPDPASPVWDVDHGADGVLIEMARTLTRDGVYNAVVATGEIPVDDTPPVRAVAYDLNPDSPTYWHGGFGKVPRFYSSPFVTTRDQAVSAAAAMLRRSIGLPHTADLTHVPNPALEPLDPVRVRYSDRGSSGEVHVLEQITLPLVADQAMTATTREQTTVMIGAA